ncbi:bifunctional diaminohydroxyphosphoribosylaminopyrimidine deaminase/5-amino-6-(5-phosphoribosylamino)uracil reductase RibD [Thalassomonas haliotis]|uniref:Riboflavin biosynthesis protein RibD n=1 Tax=Thalassomonas haliotis TaxID=485448 RepID=A0ABY7VKX0_9GAMM|nr:bifunctional diaminohydroxyphosphoribosylaminopyrimidine deaminase/5-amino-6-(5-phosphoribosylamino)uracil reductase RibD [Thalassomonas haliotis]
MQRAISLAKKGHYTTSPNPRVGCVIVKDRQIVGEGYHIKAGTEHAEVHALAMAKEQANGAIAYVTLEPCSHFGRTPPCAQALIDSGVEQVVVAMVDPNPQVSGGGISLLEQAGITTQVGLLSEQARALNPGFVKVMSTGLPYLRCKLASSLDGKTAMANGESKWITSAQARSDVQRLRAQSCAIISGADSIIMDQAKMTVRWQELGQLKESYPKNEVRQPVRVIIDSQNRITPDLPLFATPGEVLLVRAAVENNPKWPSFVQQIQLPLAATGAGSEKIDLKLLLHALAQRGLNDILLESGARLAGAFIEQDLVDELVLYQAPKLMGGDGKSLVAMPGIESLSSAKQLAIKDIAMVGPDIRITAQLEENKTCLPE